VASITDVENALVALISGVLYPGAPPSILGYPVDIYAGWPDPATLDADMVETSPGIPTKAHVSVYPLPGERNTTRYPTTRTAGPLPDATYTLTASGQMVTVGGAAPGTYFVQNLAIFVNGTPYVYQATAAQTAAQIAAGLQALIVSGVSGTTVSGAVITLPATARIGALRIGVTAEVTREVRRQEKQVQISAWSSNPTSRAAIIDTFDPIFADTPFLTLADGSSARLTYHGSREDDFTQTQRVYRRSLIYLVEYPTTRTEVATEIVAMTTNLDDAQGDVITSTSA
jgi:hypothetical protein